MGRILLPKRLTQQPQFPVEVDYSNPLAQGLGALVNGATLYEYVTKSLPSQIGLYSALKSTIGLAGKCRSGLETTYSSTYSDIYSSVQFCKSSSPQTVFAFVSINSLGVIQGLVGTAATGVSASGIGLKLNGSNQIRVGVNNSYVVGATLTSNKLYFLVGTADGTDAKIYVNSALSASGAMGLPSTTAVDGFIINGAYSTCSFANIYLSGGYGRCLSASEVKELTNNPWQLFKPINRVLYFDVAGGGVSGTFGVTLENFISSFTGTTIVTGTLNKTIDNATSSITGTTGIIGTISNTLENNTSSIIGTVSITGTISNTIEDFTSSISGSLGSAVTGSISVTLQDNTPDITGTTAITGNVSVTIDVYESDIIGTTTIVGTIAQQMENFTSSIHGFIGDEDIQARLRTLLGMGT